jgi:hypothetical protein
MAQIETDAREGEHVLWLAATSDNKLVDASVLQTVAAHIRVTCIDAEVRVTDHDDIACLAISGDKIGRNHALQRGCEAIYKRGGQWVMTTADFGWLKKYLLEHASG